jgi:hypothetical protein
VIRIANGQGFWGDWLEAPVRLLEQGPIDYLTLDYLAEVTMAILEKQRRRDPNLGYARDFPPLIARIAPKLRGKVKVLANAGGVNPAACAREVLRLAPLLKVAVVTGDNLTSRLDGLLAAGHELRNMDTGAALSTVRDRVVSANAYLGAFPLAQALATGADVVISGRCADAALTLAPMIHRFGWSETAWDLLAAGIVAGHVIECGAQATGGNAQGDWMGIPDPAGIGYPIVEAEADGAFIITKHPGTGGRVSTDTIKEQLLYEIGDPRRYVTPDVVTDFTALRLDQLGPDRVRVSGARGAPGTGTLKVSLNYFAGWKAIGTLVYSWPQAIEKAHRADRIVRERLRGLGLQFDAVYTELLGVNACHGPAAPPVGDPPEVQLRIGVRGQDRDAVERFTRELIPLVLGGPPTATGYGDGRPVVHEILAYWPALVPRSTVQPRVEVMK